MGKEIVFLNKPLDQGHQIANRMIWMNSRGIGIGVHERICRNIHRGIGVDMHTSWGHRHTHRHD